MTTTVHRTAVLWHNPAADRGGEDDYIFFGDDNLYGPTLALDEREWERMGSPLIVSVTVYAADLRGGT